MNGEKLIFEEPDNEFVRILVTKTCAIIGINGES
jgi:hypothetical protein